MPEVTTTGNDLPPIDCPSLHTSGKFRMNQLKKYLIQKLGLSSASQPAVSFFFFLECFPLTF